MYAQAEAENQAMTNIFRFLGFFIMAGGIYLILRPIEVFADVLPIVGDIIGCGLVYIACTVAGILTTITIAIAWLIHHPKIGIIVLLCVSAFVLGVAYCVKKVQEGKDEPPKQPSSEPEPEQKPEEANDDGDVEIVIDPEDMK